MLQVRPTLFYTVGYPGAGKTTFARKLSCELKLIHLYGDKVGYELFGRPNFSANQIELVHSKMSALASYHLAQNTSVLYDCLNSTVHQRDKLRLLAGNRQAIGIWIDTPQDIARKRAGKIRISEFAENYFRMIPDSLFDRYLAVFEAPGCNEKVLRISGAEPYEAQLAAFTAQLQTML
ncbi:MAG: AAA family ATPase [Candidatus Saccharibacteria bacterium]